MLGGLSQALLLDGARQLVTQVWVKHMPEAYISATPVTIKEEKSVIALDWP
jgi:hypothetical protein